MGLHDVMLPIVLLLFLCPFPTLARYQPLPPCTQPVQNYVDALGKLFKTDYRPDQTLNNYANLSQKVIDAGVEIMPFVQAIGDDSLEKTDENIKCLESKFFRILGFK